MINQYRYIVTLPYQLAHALILHHCFRSKLRGNALFLIIAAVLSHADHTGLPRDTLLKKALFACDEITGLITAVALVRPSRSLFDLEASSVRKKWKDKAFAAGTDRLMMETGAREFGVELWEHVTNVIIAMRGIAVDLDLVGSNPE